MPMCYTACTVSRDMSLLCQHCDTVAVHTTLSQHWSNSDTLNCCHSVDRIPHIDSHWLLVCICVTDAHVWLKFMNLSCLYAITQYDVHMNVCLRTCHSHHRACRSIIAEEVAKGLRKCVSCLIPSSPCWLWFTLACPVHCTWCIECKWYDRCNLLSCSTYWSATVFCVHVNSLLIITLGKKCIKTACTSLCRNLCVVACSQVLC